jgi:Tfp pilus assembly protein FimT
MVSMALPVASGVLKRNGIDTAESQLLNALSLGQAHGKRLGNDVFICAGTAKDQCLGNNWSDGLSLFRIDMEGSSQNLKIIRAFDALPVGVKILNSKKRVHVSKHGSFSNGPYVVTICHPDLKNYWVQVKTSGFKVESIHHHDDGKVVNCTVAG